MFDKCYPFVKSTRPVCHDTVSISDVVCTHPDVFEQMMGLLPQASWTFFVCHGAKPSVVTPFRTRFLFDLNFTPSNILYRHSKFNT